MLKLAIIFIKLRPILITKILFDVCEILIIKGLKEIYQILQILE